jgi:hypothetical protein
MIQLDTRLFLTMRIQVNWGKKLTFGVKDIKSPKEINKNPKHVLVVASRGSSRGHAQSVQSHRFDWVVVSCGLLTSDNWLQQMSEVRRSKSKKNLAELTTFQLNWLILYHRIMRPTFKIHRQILIPNSCILFIYFLRGPQGYIFFFLIIYSFLHTCIHCLGHLSPLHPTPSFSPPPSALLGRNCSALLSNFVEEKTWAIIRKT